jgi:hypothetical protein
MFSVDMLSKVKCTTFHSPYNFPEISRAVLTTSTVKICITSSNQTTGHGKVLLKKHTQQNSFNLAYGNSQILTIWHLMKVVP